jgi:hypothetical protein
MVEVPFIGSGVRRGEALGESRSPVKWSLTPSVLK